MKNKATMHWGPAHRVRETTAALRPKIWHDGDSPAPELDEMQGGDGGCRVGVRRGENVAQENGAPAVIGVL
jgi:hypothetical protein